MFNESNLHQLLDKFHTIFTHESADKIAKSVGLVQRSTGKLVPLHFLFLMVIEMLRFSTQALSSMTDALASMKGGSRLTPQALTERLKAPFAGRFLKRCYADVLRNRIKFPVNECIRKGILARFTSVLIEDSTACSLHQRASEFFRGVGGSASKASYKIHLLWDCIRSDIESLVVTEGCVTDQSTAGWILQSIKEGALIIRDLGYFSIPVFAKINEQGAYFLSRFKRGVCVYTAAGEQINDLSKYLDQLLANDPVVEIDVLIGKNEKLPVRLIASRVPDHVYNQRMRKANQVSRKQGYKVTKSTKEWNRYNLFITNAPSELLTKDEVAVIYSLRWQIELTFKAWKSLLHIDIITGHSTSRLHCFILGRLIAVMLISSLYSHVRQIVYEATGRELSLYKFLSWIRRHMEILTSQEQANLLLKILDSAILGCCKQRRRRKTTYELLEDCATYDDLYPVLDQNAHDRKIA